MLFCSMLMIFKILLNTSIQLCCYTFSLSWLVEQAIHCKLNVAITFFTAERYYIVIFTSVEWREDVQSYSIKVKAFYLSFNNEQRCRAAVRHAHGSLCFPLPAIPSRHEQLSAVCSSQSPLSGSLQTQSQAGRLSSQPSVVAVMPVDVVQHPGGFVHVYPCVVSSSLSNTLVALLGSTRLGAAGN